MYQENEYQYYMEEIDEKMHEEFNRDKEEGEYVIGSYITIPAYYINNYFAGTSRYSRLLWLHMTIKNDYFFEYNYNIINKYLSFPVLPNDIVTNNVGILKIGCDYYNNGTNVVYPIDKTIWLRIIQRKWKKIMKERKRIIIKRMNPRILDLRTIKGRWEEEVNYLPGIRGCLNELKRIRFK